MGIRRVPISDIFVIKPSGPENYVKNDSQTYGHSYISALMGVS